MRNKDEDKVYDLPLHYKNEELIDKLIMGELLNFSEIEQLMERTIKEFKRTFSAPNKNVEIIFREFKGKDLNDVLKEIDEKIQKDTKDNDNKPKDGDKNEKYNLYTDDDLNLMEKEFLNSQNIDKESSFEKNDEREN